MIIIIRFSFIYYILDPIPLVTSGWSLPLGSNEAKKGCDERGRKKNMVDAHEIVHKFNILNKMV